MIVTAKKDTRETNTIDVFL